MLPKVQNMRNPSSGKVVPNQFIIHCGDKTVFQSYKSTIAVKYFDGRVELAKYSWDYSTTTGKYRNWFLNETKRETEQKIANGTYRLEKL